MAVLIPVGKAAVLSLGNQYGVQATFTAIANNDTWTPGLKTINGCSITNGASGQTIGATYSAGTITFLASGALANVAVLAVGT